MLTLPRIWATARVLMAGTMTANADVFYDFSGTCESACDGFSTWGLDLAPSFVAGDQDLLF
jgi:hypothetical protein